MKQLNTMRSLLTGVLAMVFVLGSAGIANAQGTEDFTNSNATATYADGSFVGNGGITWTYGRSRNEDTYPIDGKGIMLQRASDSFLEAVITGGVGNFSFEYRKAFIGIAERQLELIVNGTQFTTTPIFGTVSGADATIFTLNAEDINTAGDVTIRIKNVGSTTTGRQTVIDNISWTGYVTAEPFVTPAPTTITELNYIHGSGPSNVQSFTLTGENLDETDVTVTAPANFDVSTSSSTGFGTSVTLSAYNGSEQTIYVRLSEGLSVAEYSGNVSITGGGLASTATVPISGEVRERIFLIYEFTGDSVVPSQSPTNSTTSNFQISSGEITFGTTGTWSGSGTPYAQANSGWNETSKEDAKNFNFTITPDVSYGVSVSNISFEWRTTGAGPSAITVEVNGAEVSTFNSGSNAQGTYTESLSLTNQKNIEIKIKGWSNGSRSTSGAGDFRINDVRLDGELVEDIYFADFTGSAGYRLLSSPVEVSLQNFLAPVWTQGATAGADTDAGNPNVFTWNNSATNDDAANWSGVTDLTANLSAGNGVLVYVFQDDVYETPGSFPKTLSVSGTVNTLPVTPAMNANSGGLTLVGNPIASIISWTALSRTDLSNTVYAWDPNTTLGDGGTDANNPSAGSWKTYNTSIGDLTDGRIHPFQAFFVQTSGNSPVLSIAQGAESTGGSFYGKETAPYAVRLQLDGEATSASKWLSFTGDAEVGLDNSDALQFQPLSLEYSLLASKLTDGTLLDINNLPVDLQETVRFPLIVESTQSGTHTLRVTELNLPTGYEVSILDNVTSLEHPLTPDFELSFELGTVAKNVPTPQNVIASGNLVAKAVEGDDRFELIVSPGTTLSNGILSELPAELALGQNYPNPFNPTTRIAFELPSSQFVKLSVFNMLGQEVSTLLQSEMNAGSHFVNFDASQLSSGVYVYRLEAGGQVITRKMTLVK